MRASPRLSIVISVALILSVSTDSFAQRRGAPSPKSSSSEIGGSARPHDWSKDVSWPQVEMRKWNPPNNQRKNRILWEAMLAADRTEFQLTTAERFGAQPFRFTSRERASNYFPRQQFTDSVVDGSIVLSALPHTALEFENMYKHKPSPEQESYMKSYYKLDAQSDRLVKADLLQKIAQSREDVIIIIGHNIDGNFYNLDGSSIQISDIIARCALEGKLCVVLSCQSRSYIRSGDRQLAKSVIGVRFDITPNQALELAAKVQFRLKARTSSYNSHWRQPPHFNQALSSEEILNEIKNLADQADIDIAFAVTKNTTSKVVVAIMVGLVSACYKPLLDEGEVDIDCFE